MRANSRSLATLASDWPLERPMFLEIGTPFRLQLLHFVWSEMPNFSRLDVQFQRTVTYSLDLLDVMSDLLEHAPDLAVAAFNQRNLVPGVG
jgi:hypothetical protein